MAGGNPVELRPTLAVDQLKGLRNGLEAIEDLMLGVVGNVWSAHIRIPVNVMIGQDPAYLWVGAYVLKVCGQVGMILIPVHIEMSVERCGATNSQHVSAAVPWIGQDLLADRYMAAHSLHQQEFVS